MNIYESNKNLRNLSSHNSIKVFEYRKMGSANYVGRALGEKRLYNCSSEGDVSLRIHGRKSEKKYFVVEVSFHQTNPANDNLM
jgi:hypothetical protein